MPTLNGLLKQAKNGDRAAAIEAWNAAREAHQFAEALEAAALIGYQQQVEEWWGELLRQDDKQPACDLAKALGLKLRPKHIQELCDKVSYANGSRTSAFMDEYTAIGLFVQAALQREDTTFACSRATLSGCTVFFAGYTVDALKVIVAKVQPERGYVDEDHEDYGDLKEWQREFPIKPTPASIWGENFEGWKEAEPATRLDMFRTEFSGKIPSSISIKANKRKPKFLTKETPVTPGTDILSDKDNKLLNKALAVIEQATSEEQQHLQWCILQELLTKAAPLNEIAITLLNRALEHWRPENRRLYFQNDVLSPEVSKTAPLARYAYFEAPFHTRAIVWAGEGYLRNILSLDTPTGGYAPTELLQHKRLENLRHLRLRWLERCSLGVALEGDKGWEEFLELPCLKRLTSLTLTVAGESRNKQRLKPLSDLLLRILEQTTGLTALTLEGCSMTEPLVQQILSLPDLERLTLSRSQFAKGAANAMKGPLPPQLTHLHVSKMYWPFAAIGPKNNPTPTIRTLRIDTNTNEERDAKHVDKFCASPCFQQLERFQSSANPAGLVGLAKHKALPNLTTIQIDAYEFNASDAQAMLSGAFPALEHFALDHLSMFYHGTEIDVDGLFTALMDPERFPALTTLRLPLRLANEDTLFEVLQRAPSPHLQELRLPDIAKLTPRMGKALADWPGLAHLKKLTIETYEGKVFKKAKETILASPQLHEDLVIVANREQW